MNASSSKFQLIYDLISRENNILTVSDLCSIAGVSRSGYYNWVKSKSFRDKQEQQDREDFDLILQAFSYRGYDKGI